jgi:Putative Ig domain
MFDFLKSKKPRRITIMATATVDLSILVSPAAEQIVIDASGVPDTAEVGVAYSGVLEASGGVSPYTWAVTAGSLPDGLTLDPNAGTITGTPAADSVGDDSFSVTATDSSGASASLKVKTPANRKK